MREEETLLLKTDTAAGGRTGKKTMNKRILMGVLIAAVNVILFCALGLLEEDREVSCVFLLDTSISMAGEPLQKGIESIWETIYLLEDGSRTSLVTFSDRTNEEIPFTSEQEIILQALTGVTVQGKTDISAGLVRAEEILRDEEGRKCVILLLTDGLDGSERIPAALKEDLENKQIEMIIPCLYGAETAEFKRLAEDTGGVFVTPGEPFTAEIRKAVASKSGGRAWTFLLIAVSEGVILLLYRTAALSRAKKALPNAGYMKRDEIVEAMNSNKGLSYHGIKSIINDRK